MKTEDWCDSRGDHSSEDITCQEVSWHRLAQKWQKHIQDGGAGIEDRRLWRVSWRSQLRRHYLLRSELYSSQRSNNLSRCQHGLHGDVHEVQLVVAVIVWSHEKGDSYILKEWTLGHHHYECVLRLHGWKNKSEVCASFFSLIVFFHDKFYLLNMWLLMFSLFFVTHVVISFYRPHHDFSFLPSRLESLLFARVDRMERGE